MELPYIIRNRDSQPTAWQDCRAARLPTCAVIRANSLFYPFLIASRFPAATRYLFYLLFPSFLFISCLFQSIPVFTGWFFQSQRWTAALDSVTLKCISCKILPFCESVIFRKKCRKQLGRQSLKGTCKSQGGSDRKLDRTEGNKKNQVQTKFCDYGNNSSSSINGEKHHDGGIGKRTSE